MKENLRLKIDKPMKSHYIDVWKIIFLSVFKLSTSTEQN